MTRLEELALIARCVAADDRNAFGCLVDAHAPALHAFVFNLTTGDAALTDDITQETFVKAYTSLRSFRGLARFKTWLYTIAVNEYGTQMRRRRELSISQCGTDLPEQGYNPGADVDTSHDVQAAMRILSDAERTLILLFYFEDRPIKEIVKITGMPEGTVKSYLSRAKKKMEKFLSPSTKKS